MAEELKEIRTRFAPAPTGFLHIGGARTALFNFLFAKKNQGRFILRIEDTDVERSKPEWEKEILDSLRWLGIELDEAPDIGGDFGPYRQSERREIYAKYLKKLISRGKAYYCFCSEEELEAHRQYLLSIGQPPIIRDEKCVNLDSKTVKKYLAEAKPSIIRFKTPIKKVVFEDLIRGKIEFDTSSISNFSLARDLRSPLYNFACAIDDFEMKISHAIRGEEHISNTPKQILIQKALGFPTPEYAHVPMILGPDRSKLSKRHGAVGISNYKKMGYLPEALVNFMAFLGWNPGTEREIYSMASLIKDFSLERVGKAGAIFNIKRLDWLNGFYIRQKSPEKLTELCIPYLIEAGLIERVGPEPQQAGYGAGEGGNPSPEELKLFEEKPQFKIKEAGEFLTMGKLMAIIGLYQTRIKKLSDIAEDCDFFFRDRLSYEKELLCWQDMSNQEVFNTLDRIGKVFSGIEENNWTKENLKSALMPDTEDLEDRGYVLWPLRVALTGKKGSAGPLEIAEILGKQKTLQRIGEAKKLKSN